MRTLTFILISVIAGCSAPVEPAVMEPPVVEPVCDVRPAIFREAFEEFSKELSAEQKTLLRQAFSIADISRAIQKLRSGGVTGPFFYSSHVPDSPYYEPLDFFESNGVAGDGYMYWTFIGGFTRYLRCEPVEMQQLIKDFAPPLPPPPRPSPVGLELLYVSPVA